MRGAWEALHEYIFELRTKTGVPQAGLRQRGVGCDGARTRYSARVSHVEPQQSADGAVLEEVNSASCL